MATAIDREAALAVVKGVSARLGVGETGAELLGPIADNALQGRAKAESDRHGHAPCERWSIVQHDDTPERMEYPASPRTHTRRAFRS